MKYGSDVEVLEMLQAVQAPLSRLEGGDADTSGGGEDEVGSELGERDRESQRERERQRE